MAKKKALQKAPRRHGLIAALRRRKLKRRRSLAVDILLFILLGAFGQLFYGFGTDEFDGSARVQQSTHLAQAHLSAADHERRAAIDDEIERNGFPDGAFRAAHGQAPMRTDEMTPGGMGGTVPPVSMLWTASNTSSHVW